jgi:hypothetical protein
VKAVVEGAGYNILNQHIEVMTTVDLARVPGLREWVWLRDTRGTGEWWEVWRVLWRPEETTKLLVRPAPIGNQQAQQEV